MLKQQQRLHLTADITAVYRRGKKIYHPLIRFLYLATQHPIARVTVIVSYKVSPRATRRNLVKRRLRVALRLPLLHLVRPCDMIVIAQPAARQASYQELAQAVGQVFRQAKLV